MLVSPTGTAGNGVGHRKLKKKKLLKEAAWFRALAGPFGVKEGRKCDRRYEGTQLHLLLLSGGRKMRREGNEVLPKKEEQEEKGKKKEEKAGF
ncbi:hypothetical protein JCGZ_20226 [Jatropha curcas]|uniref:Uncharacterized protein n=1 Tax=Jatropha curcas TaxID=180498 RepID=A0A067K6P5_JATCU|nr:hypothetical protein JCGZ_20226 [Jatropha curcas]